LQTRQRFESICAATEERLATAALLHELQEPNPEHPMRSIDDIIAEAQKATAASVREAFEAGRAHIASELKARMAAFFEGLVSGETGSHPEHHPTPSSDEHHHSDHNEHHQG
jgi:hypothetical protein